MALFDSPALSLCLMPACAMMLLSLVAINVQVPVKIVSALQHLAAGIVLSAVAVELVPPILDAPDDLATTFGMTVGFVLGITLFLALGKFCSHDDDDDDDAANDADPSEHKHTPYSTPGSEAKSRRSSHTETKLGMMREINDHPMPEPPFPVALAVAVGTDAAVDGLLIGISTTSGESAGLIIAIALTIEMGFLGLTFAATLRNQPHGRRALAICAPPLLLILGGLVGGALGAALSASPPLHTGLLAFGVAALLYLVTEELLLEAHESQPEEHIWWVDACFFLGFGLSLFLEKSTRGRTH